jgi:hypothetical protein
MPKQPDQPPYHPSKRRLISFDPTVHMGHIITAATVAGTAAIMWGTTLSDIHSMKDQLAKHDQWIDSISKREYDDHSQVLEKIDSNMNLLRAEMATGFARLGDKIDEKADKR